TVCRSDGVCDGAGRCVTCVTGMSCSTDPCRPAAIACGTGAPVCVTMGAAAMGTPCPGGMCDGAGTCAPGCTAGASCSTGNPCTQGVTVCSGSTMMCATASNNAAGSPCPGGVCDGSGTCTPCVQGSACTSANDCVTAAQIVCSSGAPVCTA